MENPTTPAKLIRLPTVEDRTGLRKSYIYQQIAAGTFPKPIKIGRRTTVFIEAEVDAWIRARIADGERARAIAA